MKRILWLLALAANPMHQSSQAVEIFNNQQQAQSLASTGKENAGEEDYHHIIKMLTGVEDVRKATSFSAEDLAEARKEITKPVEQSPKPAAVAADKSQQKNQQSQQGAAKVSNLTAKKDEARPKAPQVSLEKANTSQPANKTQHQAQLEDRKQEYQDLAVKRHRHKAAHSLSSQSKLDFDAKMKHGAGPEEDEADKVETELTRWIKRMDTAIPVEQIAKEAEAEAAKPKVIVAPSAPATPTVTGAPKVHEPTAEEIRAKHMDEIHKQAWEVYQCEKFGNTMKPPGEGDQEAKRCHEANRTVVAGEKEKEARTEIAATSTKKKKTAGRIAKSQVDRKAKAKAEGKPLKEFSVEVKVKGKGEDGEKENEKTYTGKLFEKKQGKPKTKKKPEAKEPERPEQENKEDKKNDTGKICSQHAHNRTKEEISFNLSQRAESFDASANPFQFQIRGVEQQLSQASPAGQKFDNFTIKNETKTAPTLIETNTTKLANESKSNVTVLAEEHGEPKTFSMGNLSIFDFKMNNHSPFKGKQALVSLTQAGVDRSPLGLSSIVEQSRGLLDSIESKDEPAPEQPKHTEDIVALDKNYEKKSHAFAKDFLEKIQEKQEAKEAKQAKLFEGVLGQSKSLFSDLKEKNDREEKDVQEMKKKLEGANNQVDLESVSSHFLGKINEIKSAVDEEASAKKGAAQPATKRAEPPKKHKKQKKTKKKTKKGKKSHKKSKEGQDNGLKTTAKLHEVLAKAQQISESAHHAKHNKTQHAGHKKHKAHKAKHQAQKNATGTVSDKQYKDLQEKLNQTESELNTLKKEVKERNTSEQKEKERMENEQRQAAKHKEEAAKKHEAALKKEAAKKKEAAQKDKAKKEDAKKKEKEASQKKDAQKDHEAEGVPKKEHEEETAKVLDHKKHKHLASTGHHLKHLKKQKHGHQLAAHSKKKAKHHNSTKLASQTSKDDAAAASPEKIRDVLKDSESATRKADSVTSSASSLLRHLQSDEHHHDYRDKKYYGGDYGAVYRPSRHLFDDLDDGWLTHFQRNQKRRHSNNKRRYKNWFDYDSYDDFSASKSGNFMKEGLHVKKETSPVYDDKGHMDPELFNLLKPQVRGSKDPSESYSDRFVNHHRGADTLTNKIMARDRRYRDDKYESPSSSGRVHFPDDYPPYDSSYKSQNILHKGRRNTHGIQSEYPFKPQRWNHNKHDDFGGHGGHVGGMFEPNHYVDYELSTKEAPSENKDSKEESPSENKDLKDLKDNLKELKDTLVQESSEKAPKQLNIHNQQLMEKYMSKGSVVFRGVSEEEQRQEEKNKSLPSDNDKQ